MSEKEALEYAIAIIELYQAEIRAGTWVGVNLVEKGFCQGKVFDEAIKDIRRIAERN